MVPSGKGRTVVFDAEANGLLDHTNLRMWCIVAEDYDTAALFLFHDYPQMDNMLFEVDGVNKMLKPRDGTLEEGIHFLNNAKSLICHNMLGYDNRLIKKFYPWFNERFTWPEIRDTMLESQVQFYDRSPVKGFRGVHGLAPWGKRLNIEKPEIKDFTVITPLLLHRCLEDVRINTAVAREMEEERILLMDKCGLDFEEALKTEQEYRHYSSVQEKNGALVDKPHMEWCCTDLDVLIEENRKVIEPQLPPSVDVLSTKTTVNEVQQAMGFAPSDCKPIEYTWKEIKGKMDRHPIREMYKPVTKWTKANNIRYYAGCADGLVVTKYRFTKMKDAKAHMIEAGYVKSRVKLTYPSKIEHGSSLNAHTTTYFEDTENFEIVGPFTRVEITPSTMSQHEKVKLLLVGLGWQPDEWTFKKDASGSFERPKAPGVVNWPDHKVNGYQLSISYKAGGLLPVTPKLTEKSYDTLPEGVGQTVARFNTYNHRRKFIQNPHKGDKGLLNNIRPDGRITAGIMTFGTSAGRASQSLWVNAPSVQALYGENIRKIVIASPDHTLVGVDMPSAHPRILADDMFTGNQLFQDSVDGIEAYEDDDGNDVYVGKDFHTVNSVLFRLNKQEDVDKARETQDHELIGFLAKGRKIGKGGSYCKLYGGGDNKLATTIGIPVALGKEIGDAFIEGLGLDKVLKEAEEVWDSRKRRNGSYISVLGGYHIWSNSKHKIINYKALGSEAVIQKHAVIWINREIIKRGWQDRVLQIINMHDELLFDCPDELLTEFKPLAARMYDEAAKGLGLTLNWMSHALTGQNYAVCH